MGPAVRALTSVHAPRRPYVQGCRSRPPNQSLQPVWANRNTLVLRQACLSGLTLSCACSVPEIWLLLLLFFYVFDERNELTDHPRITPHGGLRITPLELELEHAVLGRNRKKAARGVRFKSGLVVVDGIKHKTLMLCGHDSPPRKSQLAIFKEDIDLDRS